jgi:Beta-propeller repeat
MARPDARVRFVARRAGYAFFITNTESVAVLQKPGAAPAILRMQLIGASRHPRVEGDQLFEGKSNYLIGSDRSKWRTNVPHFRGSGSDSGWSVAVDSAGNAYVAGATESTNFPSANAISRRSDRHRHDPGRRNLRLRHTESGKLQRPSHRHLHPRHAHQRRHGHDHPGRPPRRRGPFQQHGRRHRHLIRSQPRQRLLDRHRLRPASPCGPRRRSRTGREDPDAPGRAAAGFGLWMVGRRS